MRGMDRSFRAPDIRGRTLPLGSVMKEKEDELSLFIEMRKRDKERNSLLLQSTDELDQPLELHPGGSPLYKIVPSVLRKTGMDDFLNWDCEKNDYDWLLTPPGTPLFPSLEKEPHRSTARHLSTPKGQPILLKSRLANPPDTSSRCTTASAQLMTHSSLNSSLLGMRRPSSSGGSSVTSSRPSTPNGRPSVHTTSKPSRSSTPTSRPKVPSSSAAAPPRSSSPARSSTPASRSSIPPASKPASRSTTPTRRPSSPSNLPSSFIPPRRSSSVTRSGPATSSAIRSSSSTATTRPEVPGPLALPAPSSNSKSAPTTSKGVVPSRGTSPTLRSRTWKPSEMPGFSLDAPPNLRTSLPDRPSSASRVRPGAPNFRSSSIESLPSARPRQSSCSPSRVRAPNGNICGGSSIPSMSRSCSNNGENESPVVIGTKMVERVVSLRRLAPPKYDDQRSNSNSLVKSSIAPESTGFGRTLSKKSFDMAMRHMDIRRSMPNSLRPLMTNIPASSTYSVKPGPSRSRAVSMSESPLATSSNASSDLSVSNNAFCLDGNGFLADSPSFSLRR